MSSCSLCVLCVFLLCAMSVGECFKVLVVLPMPGKSHTILGDAAVELLLNSGHEVTYITPFPNSLKQHPLLSEVDISSQLELIPEEAFSIDKIMKNEIDMQGLPTLLPLFVRINVALLEHENVTKLLNDPSKQFDVIILDWMFVDLLSGISAVFNCPLIWLSTTDTHWMVLRLIDEVPNPAYSVGMTSFNSPPLTFSQRVEELLQMALGHSLQYLFTASEEQREYERLLAPIMRKRGLKVPDFEAVRYNASLILGNSHVSMGIPYRLPQNFKLIGGYHIDDKVAPLPKDLQKLLDNAKNGLIYFSMGTNARGRHMPSELKTSLLRMFGNLEQTVLWKLEEDLPNKPNNVHIMSWTPQQSILAHPNCILFITHGGLLSTTEAIHFGKPIIGIPIFGDQFANVERSVKRGFTKRVDLSLAMADELEITITEVLEDPRYLNKVKELSFIYHDRPVSPGKELVHWVEHVVRTAGAPHLRSPALLMPWYQKCYLDFTVLVIAVLFSFKLLMKKTIGHFTSSKNVKKKKVFLNEIIN